MFNTLDNIPKHELETRIDSLKSHLKKNNIDGALILQNTDLYYFSGTAQQAQLYVPVDGIPMLMVRKSIERAFAESSLERIASFTSPKQIPDILRENGYAMPSVLGMELDVLPANMYLNYLSLFEGVKIVDISHQIRLIRAVKSTYEIDIIRQASRFADQVSGYMKNLLQEGITEIELAGKLEAHARKLGHQGIVRMRLWGSELFYGHLMAGASAAVPSYLASPTGGTGVSTAIAQGASLRPIRRHEPVLVDYTFAYKGYLADHTRIFALGDLPDKLMKAHEAMIDIQALIQKEARPGVKSGTLYDMAIERAAELGYAENFMGVGKERIRFVGHGVGLELDEYPFLAKGQSLLLEKGMTIAVEPKAIFPSEGVVGVENTHLITDAGLEPLTTYPDQIVVLQRRNA